MSIVAILGSPRGEGNSAGLVKTFLKAAEPFGATARTFQLNDLSFRGCQACYACKTSRDTCLLKDDLAPVLDAVREADVVVLASPVYFGDITGQLKTFFDRTFSFFTPDYRTSATPSRLAPGKKLVFVQTQGQPDPTLFDDVYPRYERFFKRFGFAETHLVRAHGVANAGDVAGKSEFLQQAEEVAVKVFGRKDVEW